MVVNCNRLVVVVEVVVKVKVVVEVEVEVVLMIEVEKENYFFIKMKKGANLELVCQALKLGRNWMFVYIRWRRTSSGYRVPPSKGMGRGGGGVVWLESRNIPRPPVILLVVHEWKRKKETLGIVSTADKTMKIERTRERRKREGEWEVGNGLYVIRQPYVLW